MVDADLLKNLIPLNNLAKGNLKRLAKKLVVEEFPQGSIICREGDTDNDAIYLVEGGVELVSHSSTLTRVMQGGTEEASYALAHARPRQFTVKATTDAKIIRIDNAKLDRVVVLDELTTTITKMHGAEGKKFGGDSGWLEEMLGSKAFSKLPAEKIAPLMLKMEAVSVKSGHVVFKQGDSADYYYVVKKGRFSVSRKDEQGKVKILEELREGSVFGEESLISGELRGVSIVAMGKGTLMRLAKKDFEELLKKPLLNFVASKEANQMVKAGAGLLDVRTKKEYKKGALRGSLNVPVSELRNKLDKLDRSRKYVISCEMGIQSEVAAFLLSQRGFDVCVLKGGLQAITKKN